MTALIDTGASCSFLNAGLFERLGHHFDEKDALGFGADFPVASFLAEKVEIGGALLENILISKNNMEPINRSLETMGLKRVDGILGSDLLRRLNAKIDFSTQQLFIGETTAPFWNESEIVQPNITISFDSQELTMILDTGASQTLLNDPAAERLFPGASWENNESPSIGISPSDILENRTQAKLFFDASETARTADFIALKMHNINAAYDLLGVPRIDAILGADFFYRHRTVIDFQDATLKLSV